MLTYPKIVAFDLDGTAWYQWLNGKKFKNLVVPHQKEDNLEYVTHNGQHSVRDKRNHQNNVILATDFPRIITELVMRDVHIAIVSRNTDKALCDRALYYFQAKDPKTKEDRSIIEYIEYDEVKNESKLNHFHRIKGWSGLPYHEMLIFDDLPLNLEVETWEGVTFKLITHKTGITWDDFMSGISEWRGNQRINVPFNSDFRLLDPHPNKMLIGYVGTDIDGAKAYAAGERRPFSKTTRPARWGYGLYVADNPQVAMFFAQWKRDKNISQLRVCKVYARDRDTFKNKLAKVWFWPNPAYMTDNVHSSKQQIASKQLELDKHLQEAFDVKKPYILFSRHNYMPPMGQQEYQLSINPNKRFNEMVIYPQIQDALMYGHVLTLTEARKIHMTGKLPKIQYEHHVKDWNIVVPPATKQDCERRGEHNFFK
ncbi:hypothetical protein K435DRAFT_769697 [Dendrothele bispora CBS 962.96]|uniref:Uncharacterized protein n=1 Tax=Dendrothele bispora (strain CBS 962.96) TaxID=1314807 RepID=A0A4S8KRU2_DENBC|nr:hypothetical protein K435DRAFT_769697 [Dendrothele bispora CBS 962.96]